jgi:hypothetical protein
MVRGSKQIPPRCAATAMTAPLLGCSEKSPLQGARAGVTMLITK